MSGHLMSQCAREPGLAYFLESLLGIDGNELRANLFERQMSVG